MALGTVLSLGPVAHASSPDAAAAQCSAANDGDFRDRDGWPVHLGPAMADTIDAPPDEALAAASQVFVDDDWIISRCDAAAGRVVTDWKPLHHILVRLVMGSCRARCVVDVTPLADGRSLVVLHGGIATRSFERAQPFLPRADRAYRQAALNYDIKIQRVLERRYVAQAAWRAAHPEVPTTPVMTTIH